MLMVIGGEEGKRGGGVIMSDIKKVRVRVREYKENVGDRVK